MAQVPPAAVFRSNYPGQPVHVLLLIENSLPMVEHWPDLQRHILPNLLGAVRIANPGINVQVFWETTGKSQDQQSSQKSQRHFNDFPDIDIVGLPQNKLSPLFIRQSVELFLVDTDPTRHVTRHLFIAAMSSPVDYPPTKVDAPGGRCGNADWDSVVVKLQERDIILHLIVNPNAKLTPIFQLYRKVMISQSRREVIPWQHADLSRCVCHLSGSTHIETQAPQRPGTKSIAWPDINLDTSENDNLLTSSRYASEYEQAAALPAAASTKRPNIVVEDGPFSSIVGGSSVSLVSRMQAMHGLAKRKPERTRAHHSSFFSDTSPKQGKALPHSKSRSRQLPAPPTDGFDARRCVHSPAASMDSTLPTQAYHTKKRARFADLGSAIDRTAPFRGARTEPRDLPHLPPPSPSSSSTPSPLRANSVLDMAYAQPKHDGYDDLGSKGYSPAASTSSSLSVESLLSYQSPMPAPGQYARSTPRFPSAAVTLVPDKSSQNRSTASFGASMSNYMLSSDYYRSAASQQVVNQHDCFSPAYVRYADTTSHTISGQNATTVTSSPESSGQEPFVFDVEYEAASAVRSQQAMATLQSEGDSSSHIPPYSQHSYPASDSTEVIGASTRLPTVTHLEHMRYSVF